MANGVYFDIANAKHRRLHVALHAMPECGAHPRHEFTDVEGLVDVIVRTEIQRLDFLRLALARGQHDDRHIGPLAHTTDHVLAIAIGKPEIEQNDIGRLGCDALDRIGDRGRARHLVAVGLERRLEETQDRHLVVDDQHARFRSHAGMSSRGNSITNLVPGCPSTGLSTAIDPP
jgi:hypothetical protein